MGLADDMIAVLDDPTHMWSHALKELSSDAQRLFLTLTLLPKPVSSDILQIAYTSMASSRSESFIDSLRSLEDSFIVIERQYLDVRSVNFKNPSLEDFAITYVDQNFDWLDTLLSAPTYYEQLTGAFGLAMAQTAILIDTKTRARKDAKPKYPGIKRWVSWRSGQLIEAAVDLLDSERASLYFYPRGSRLGELLEIMANYGLPSSDESLSKLYAAASSALAPVGRSEAALMMQFLKKPIYRRLLDSITRGSAADVMRQNILDKDGWKFSVLAEIDKLLKLDEEESWDSWGDDYIHYARQLSEDLADSDDDEELRVAIEELETASSWLGVSVYEYTSVLEERRENLPEGNDYDDTSRIRPSATQTDDSAELDKVFATLL